MLLWQSSAVGPGGLSILRWRSPGGGGEEAAGAGRGAAVPRLRPAAFNLTDFGGVGDGVTVNTAAFERAVAAIAKLGKRGGGQLNVPAGQWLTAPFNLTSHMTLFLAEGAVILGIEVGACFGSAPVLLKFCEQLMLCFPSSFG